jgi:hypothetical protein
MLFIDQIVAVDAVGLFSQIEEDFGIYRDAEGNNLLL